FAPHRLIIRAQEKMRLMTGIGQFAAIETSDGTTTNHSNLHEVQQKGTLRFSECPGEKVSLLGPKDGVFGSFRDAKFHHALGGNINLFASCRIAADAGGAIDQHQFSQPRESESVLGVLIG